MVSWFMTASQSPLCLQVLELLQTTAIPIQSVAITLATQLQPLSALQHAAPAAEGCPSPRPASRAATPRSGAHPAGKGTGSAGTGPKAAGKAGAGRVASAASKAQGGTAANAATAAALVLAGGVPGALQQEAPAVPLANKISSAIEASKQEVEAAAKAYFAAKVTDCKLLQCCDWGKRLHASHANWSVEKPPCSLLLPCMPCMLAGVGMACPTWHSMVLPVLA